MKEIKVKAAISLIPKSSNTWCYCKITFIGKTDSNLTKVLQY